MGVLMHLYVLDFMDRSRTLSVINTNERITQVGLKFVGYFFL